MICKAYLELIQNSLMLMRRRWNELTILSPEECLDYNLITITIDEEMIQIIRRRKHWQMIKWCFKRWRWRFSSLLSRRLVPLAAPSFFLSGVIWTLILRPLCTDTQCTAVHLNTAVKEHRLQLQSLAFQPNISDFSRTRNQTSSTVGNFLTAGWKLRKAEGEEGWVWGEG